jgi:hypothetical protein
MESEVIPNVLAGSDAAMCLTFLPFPMPPGQPSDVPASADDELRFLQLWFCDADAAGSWNETFASLPEAFGDHAEVLLAAPFKGTIPGTDTYTDQL